MPYCDQATIKLISKLLKIGYVNIHNLAGRVNYNTKGIPQCSFVFPILNNIYLDAFDECIVKELLLY